MTCGFRHGWTSPPSTRRSSRGRRRGRPNPIGVDALPMQCPQCLTENPPEAKFCVECASPFARACPNCGTKLPPRAKFCPECAHPAGGASAPPRLAPLESYIPKHLAEKILTSRAALEGERKQVTVLFADLKGSMELLADWDPEEARK